MGGLLFAEYVLIFGEKPDLNLDLDTQPFSEMVNWNFKSARQSYDIILSEKYWITSYEVRYKNEHGKEVKNPWQEKEFLKVIYDKENKHVVGYIWVVENIKLPGLCYKPKPGFWEPKLLYARVDKYEIIYEPETNKTISLVSFEILGLNAVLKRWLGNDKIKRYRNVVKKIISRNYLYTLSTQKLFICGAKNFMEIQDVLYKYALEHTIWLNTIEKQDKDYKEIQKIMKQEVKKYGGKTWRKKWEDIQKLWPLMKNID